MPGSARLNGENQQDPFTQSTGPNRGASRDLSGAGIEFESNPARVASYQKVELYCSFPEREPERFGIPACGG